MTFDSRPYETVPGPGLFKVKIKVKTHINPDRWLRVGDVIFVLGPSHGFQKTFQRIMTSQGIFNCHVFWINTNCEQLS